MVVVVVVVVVVVEEVDVVVVVGGVTVHTRGLGGLTGWRTTLLVGPEPWSKYGPPVNELS